MAATACSITRFVKGSPVDLRNSKGKAMSNGNNSRPPSFTLTPTEVGMRAAALCLCFLVLQISVLPQARAAELVTITSKLQIKQQTLQPPASTPTAFVSVVLLAGGDGVLALDPQGLVTKLQGNFLVRSAYRFLSAGVNVALLDAPGSLSGIRSSEDHALYVASAVAGVRAHWPKTRVWLLGTSSGTVSAFNLAARAAKNAPAPMTPFADLPDGVVLTSPIVQGGGETVLGTTPSFQTAQLKMPVVVISHALDPCTASDPTLAAKFVASLISPLGKKFLAVKGALPAAAQSPCDAFSYHGFHGVEDAVIKTIVASIK